MSRYLIDEEDESIDDLILHGYVKKNFNNNKEESSETHSGYSPERGDDADYEQIEHNVESHKNPQISNKKLNEKEGVNNESIETHSGYSPERGDPADDEPEIGNISPTTPKEFKEDPI